MGEMVETIPSDRSRFHSNEVTSLPHSKMYEYAHNRYPKLTGFTGLSENYRKTISAGAFTWQSMQAACDCFAPLKAIV